MAPIVHEIDPDADTLIVLKNASTVFAPWYKNEKGQAQTQMNLDATDDDAYPPVKSSKKKKTKKIWMGARAPNGLHADMNNDIVAPNAGIEQGMVPESMVGASAVAYDILNTPSPGRKPELVEKPDIEDIHFRVSSRHLMLASPWFKRAMTKEGWSESNRNDEDGLFHITADDWDAEAFLILLNIIHLRNKKVPRRILLEQLAKIAILVDYYECGEVMEMFTDMWIESLETSAPIPSVYCRDLVLWIWTSWVFDMSDQFKRATAVAIKRTDKTLSTLDLPIPNMVVDEIDLKRYQAIESVIEQLHSLLDEYRAATYECPHEDTYSFQCGSFLLGALTKEMDGIHLLSPRPEVPFPNLRFDDVCDKVKATKSPAWSHSNPNHYYSDDHHSCNLNTRVNGIITKAASAVVGLNLSETKQGKASHS